MDIQVYEDSVDQENVGVQTRNGSRKGETNVAAPKRTALGAVNNLRQQPSRAAKGAPFKVYEDSENVAPQTRNEAPKKVKIPKKSNNVALSSIAAANSVASGAVGGAVVGAASTACSSAILQLPPIQQEEDEAFADALNSPMVLDISCMETAETTSVRVDPFVNRDLVLYALQEYQEDIHNHLRESELKQRPKLHYMRKQSDITPQMRTILIDWLVEVCEEYKLHDETLHLAVNYIDRFLSQMSVLRGKLQLVGTACMFISSKYEEIYPPDVGEFVYITDDTYTKRQLLRMEHLVIKVLSFDVAVPTANVFLDMYCKQLNTTDELKHLAQYAMELSLLDSENYLAYRPSVIASAALFLAAHILSIRTLEDTTPSPNDIEKVTRYQQVEVAPCVQRLVTTLRTAHEQPQQAVREKYRSDSRRAVSLIPFADLI